jgi:outer membrane protein TolC
LLLAWEPVDFGYRRALIETARAGETTAVAQAELTRLDVALRVTSAYLSLLAAQQVTRTAQADVERRQVLANSVAVLVQNQLRAGADASRAEADLAQARIRLIEAQTNENVSRAVLASLLGVDGTAVQVVAGPLLQPPSAVSVPAQQPAASPLAAMQMARVAESQARDRTLARSYFPRLSVQSGISGRGSSLNESGQLLNGRSGLDLQRMNWAVGMQVTFPLLQIFTTRALRSVEQANEQAARARYDETLLNISASTAQAQIRLEGARQVAQNTPAEVAAARDAEQQARARYEAGLVTLVEVSDAQSLLVNAEIDDAIARLNVWRSLAELAGAQGDLEPVLNLVRTAGP